MKVRRLAVTPTIFVEFCKRGTDAIDVVDHALPPDATADGCAYDYVNRVVWIFVRSETFDDIDENAAVPEHPRVTFAKRHVHA